MADIPDDVLDEVERALDAVFASCDRAGMMPRPGSGICGMTIEANIRGSVYRCVDAWPIEIARSALDRLRDAREVK